MCVQHEQLNSTSFLLLIVLFAYPAAVCTLVGLCKWRDDGRLMAPFTVWCLLLGLLSSVLCCFLIAVLFPPWYVGAGLLLCVVSLLLLLLHILPSVHSAHTAHNAQSPLSASALAFRAVCCAFECRPASGAWRVLLRRLARVHGLVAWCSCCCARATYSATLIRCTGPPRPCLL